MAWTDLTYRQKQLDRAIEGCGVKLDGSDRCLKKVMEAIDALPDEMAFVRERIVLRLRTQQLLSDTDKFIDNTNRALDAFEKDDARWEFLGKKLGIDL
jgi:hypothetical protein